MGRKSATAAAMMMVVDHARRVDMSLQHFFSRGDRNDLDASRNR